MPKLRTHARRTARAWCLDGVPLFGISVFCALDDIGPASLPGLLNSRLRTYRCIHYCPVSALRLIGVHLLPTGHRPHFTAVIASGGEEGELRRLLACLGPPRRILTACSHHEDGEEETVIVVDIAADLNDEDDTGLV